MSKLLLTIVFMFPPVLFAEPWGGMDDYRAPRQENSQTGASVPGERYLLAHVLAGHPVRVYMEMEVEQDKYDKYASAMSENYSRWFTETAQQIRQANRAEEFADLLPLLEQGIRTEFVKEDERPDIIVIISFLARVINYCNSAAGCYIKGAATDWKVPVIVLPDLKNWQKVVTFGQISSKRIGLHEIGHSLGLSDQYAQARAENSHPVYHSAAHDSAVMNKSGELTCDDADGIINLIDITRQSRRGGDLGWHSLCRRDVVYVNGASVSAGPYAVRPWNDGRTWELETYENGILKNREIFALAEQGHSPLQKKDISEEILRRDSAGRPVLARGANGETIYYSYVYSKKTRLITDQGKVLAVEIDNPNFQMHGKSKKYHSQDFYFGENGKISLISRVRPLKAKGAEGKVVYQGRLGDNGRWEEEVEINFDKRGEIVDRASSAVQRPGRAQASAPFAGALEENVYRAPRCLSWKSG